MSTLFRPWKMLLAVANIIAILTCHPKSVIGQNATSKFPEYAVGVTETDNKELSIVLQSQKARLSTIQPIMTNITQGISLNATANRTNAMQQEAERNFINFLVQSEDDDVNAIQSWEENASNITQGKPKKKKNHGYSKVHGVYLITPARHGKNSQFNYRKDSGCPSVDEIDFCWRVASKKKSCDKKRRKPKHGGTKARTPTKLPHAKRPKNWMSTQKPTRSEIAGADEIPDHPNDKKDTNRTENDDPPHYANVKPEAKRLKPKSAKTKDNNGFHQKHTAPNGGNLASKKRFSVSGRPQSGRASSEKPHNNANDVLEVNPAAVEMERSKHKRETTNSALGGVPVKKANSSSKEAKAGGRQKAQQQGARQKPGHVQGREELIVQIQEEPKQNKNSKLTNNNKNHIPNKMQIAKLGAAKSEKLPKGSPGVVKLGQGTPKPKQSWIPATEKPQNVRNKTGKRETPIKTPASGPVNREKIMKAKDQNLAARGRRENKRMQHEGLNRESEGFLIRDKPKSAHAPRRGVHAVAKAVLQPNQKPRDPLKHSNPQGKSTENKQDKEKEASIFTRVLGHLAQTIPERVV